MNSKHIGSKEFTLTKSYDFRSMPPDKLLNEFSTSNLWPRKQVINGEKQAYLDPAKVPATDNPFWLSEIGLAIRGRLTNPALQDQFAMGLVSADLDDWSDELSDTELEKAFPQPYTSGLLISGKGGVGHTQMYGHWEVFAKMPSQIGCWSAFWLLMYNGTWPNFPMCPEVDIFEAVADTEDGVYYATAHSNQTGTSKPTENNLISTGADLINEFHLYGLSWDENYLIWHFDGQEVKRVPTPADMIGIEAVTIMNLAIGGTFPDNPDAQAWVGTPDPSEFIEPASFEIQYMNIYQEVQQHTPDAPAQCPTQKPVANEDTIDTAAYAVALNETITWLDWKATEARGKLADEFSRLSDDLSETLKNMIDER